MAMVDKRKQLLMACTYVHINRTFGRALYLRRRSVLYCNLLWGNYSKNITIWFIFVKLPLNFTKENISDSIVASIPACHAGDRGSIPRRRASFLSYVRQTVRVCV